MPPTRIDNQRQKYMKKKKKEKNNNSSFVADFGWILPTMNSSKKYGAEGHYFHSCANKETTDHYSQSRCANKNPRAHYSHSRAATANSRVLAVCPEVTLCGWQDIKIQLLLLLPLYGIWTLWLCENNTFTTLG